MTSSPAVSEFRVLIVEDEKEEFILTRGLLQGLANTRYHVTWESGFDEGLGALKAGELDACLVDYRLGKSTGIDLVQAASAHGLSIPILLHTGHREPAIDLLALECGAADYLIKGSASGEDLDRAIRHAITRQRVLQQAIRERTRLADFGSEMGRCLTRVGVLDEALRAAAQVMARFLPVELVQIHVFDPQNGEFRRVACEGNLSATPPASAPSPVDFIHGERCISCPAVEDHRLGEPAWLSQHRILTGVTCPLMMDQHLLGLISLHSRDALSHPILEELGSAVPAVGAVLARHSLEARVQRAQQMDCVGKMATGLAHEFKNNLAVIQTHAWEAMEALEDSPPAAVRELLNHITEVTESATGLVQQLMLFARPDDVAIRPVDLNASLLALRPMIQGAVDQRVGLTLRTEASSPVIESNPILLQQVVINLACNSRDAMPDGGTLVIETSNVHVDSAQAATIPEARVGDYVMMRVTDTGCGMSPETLARMCEPFFTTKPPGKGNGLGMATVFNIVRQHQGWMQISSEPGKGTCFRIHFPLSSHPLPDPPAPPSIPCTRHKPEGVKANRERVLVVEDEPVLRMAAEAVLRRANFEVTAASSGHEALKAWNDQGGRFDVLLTDLSMPDGITGAQLASQLLRENPRIKIILTSGYAPEMVECNLDGQPAMFLQKPYPPGELPDAVKSCLGI